jgi:hypothetical protein
MSLTEYKKLQVENIIFSETINSKYTKRIPIGYSCNDEDEEIQTLILNTPPNLYTNGLKEKKDDKTENVIGYHMTLNMWNRNKGPTEEEKEFVEKLKGIVNYVKQFLFSIKEELNIDEKLIEELDILSFYKNDDKTKDPPKLYCKLMLNNRSKKILTQFIDEENDENIDDPTNLIGKNGLVTTALRFENISISEKRINIEVRVFEVLYKELKKYQRRQSILPRNNNKKKNVDEESAWTSTGKVTKTVDSISENKKVSHITENPFNVLNTQV